MLMDWLQQQPAVLWAATGHVCTRPGRVEVGASEHLPIDKYVKETQGTQGMV